MLERLGVRTLGELAALDAAAVPDRFGRRGLHARELARGRDTPLRPRAFRDEPWRTARPAGGGVGAAARANARAPDRPAARAARAARAVASGSSASAHASSSRGRGGARSRCARRPWRASAFVSCSRRSSASCRRRSISSASADRVRPPASARPASLPPGRRARAPEAPPRGAAPDARGGGPRVASARARSRPAVAHPGAARRADPVSRMTARVYRPRPVNVRVGAGGGARGGRARGGRGGARAVAGRGPLVDGTPAAPPLFRARHRRRREPRSSSATSRAGAGSRSGVMDRDMTAWVPVGMTYVELHATPPIRFWTAPRARGAGAAAAEQGYPALALTDHDGLWGAMEFAQAARGSGSGRSPAPS